MSDLKSLCTPTSRIGSETCFQNLTLNPKIECRPETLSYACLSKLGLKPWLSRLERQREDSGWWERCWSKKQAFLDQKGGPKSRLKAYVYVYVCICMCIYICIYIYISIFIFFPLSLSLYLSLWLSLSLSLYAASWPGRKRRCATRGNAPAESFKALQRALPIQMRSLEAFPGRLLAQEYVFKIHSWCL